MRKGTRKTQRQELLTAEGEEESPREREHLGPPEKVLTLVKDEMLRVAFDCSRNLNQLATLAQRYEDRKPDLADLCLIRMSELYPRHTVLTVDEADFRVYRRNKRETIPILCPPGVRG